MQTNLKGRAPVDAGGADKQPQAAEEAREGRQVEVHRPRGAIQPALVAGDAEHEVQGLMSQPVKRRVPSHATMSEM